ncbi:MAG: family N-acetyltransferase, partial [Microbacteriaceae bacterium]|nr:family N-acetyltransferase [Microbacteriaceae bacterium]
AVSTYRDTGLRRVFLHTEVEPGHEHHGLATQLIEWALNDVRAKGKQIVPLCSMVAGYLDKNHDFDDIVDSPAGIEC